jgi:response regulator RpfG family c-di-GMP phosphodiesterase
MLQLGSNMTERLHVLCVDDESRVLEGLALNLRRYYRVSTATNGQKGLEIIDGDDPPGVVVSDMRMPEMDGAAFLSQVKQRSPNTVRVLLTGQADLESAIAAVNHGQIFRFLTKPCSPQIFLSAIQAAADQHRLITAERELLEKTLRGSIKALIEILSLTNPLAFGRAMRLKQYAADLVAGLGVPLSWQLEVAAMLSQIGCVTLPAATTEKLYYGRPLSSEEIELTQRLPTLSLQLLESIPRLEAVRAILQAQNHNFDGSGSPHNAMQGESIPLGARVLKLVIDYDTLEAAGTDPTMAIGTLQSRKGRYDPKLLDALAGARTKVASQGLSELKLAAVRPGMFLAQDIMSTTGLLLVARGHEVTPGLLNRLRNLPPGGLREPLVVFVPTETKRDTQKSHDVQ